METFSKYKNALRKSGYITEPTYTPKVLLTELEKEEKKKIKKRKRKVIWFNPPFSKNVKTNVGKTVIKLVWKHFPKEHMFHKIFNKNTIKVSYSCMPNIGTIISGHNKTTTLSEKGRLWLQLSKKIRVSNGRQMFDSIAANISG